jgi:hypothetical protein
MEKWRIAVALKRTEVEKRSIAQDWMGMKLRRTGEETSREDAEWTG